MNKTKFTIYSLFFLTAYFLFADSASAISVYYSVGQDGDNHSSGDNVSIVAGVAEFAVAQTTPKNRD